MNIAANSAAYARLVPQSLGAASRSAVVGALGEGGDVQAVSTRLGIARPAAVRAIAALERAGSIEGRIENGAVRWSAPRLEGCGMLVDRVA